MGEQPCEQRQETARDAGRTLLTRAWAMTVAQLLKPEGSWYLSGAVKPPLLSPSAATPPAHAAAATSSKAAAARRDLRAPTSGPP